MSNQLKWNQLWPAIELFTKLGARDYGALLQLPAINQREIGARMSIDRGLRTETVLNHQSVQYAGELWRILEERYTRVTEAEICKAIKDVMYWKKRPEHT